MLAARPTVRPTALRSRALVDPCMVPRPVVRARGGLVPARAAGKKDAGARAGGDDEGNTTLQLVAGALGTPAALLVCYSSYLLATTGDGLPPGPGGAYGAAEGVSYLAVLGLVGWSAATKAKTGSGLPAGPAGLLGAAEGLSYLALLGAVGAFGYAATHGGIPGPLGR